MDVREMLDKAQDAVTVRRAFGEPITCDGVTIIPAAGVGGGGGGGDGRRDGEQPGEGSGGGFGVRVTPAGAFVVKDGEVRWNPAIDYNKIILGGQVVAVVAILTIGAIVRRRARRA